MIAVHGVVKRFGYKYALRGVDLNIEKGERFALLGPNGAGKTTLLKIIATLLKPDRGKVFINGIDAFKNREKIKKLIGLVSHNTLLYDELTVKENLSFYADLYDVEERRINDILKFFDLYKRRNDQVSTLSRGMKQRLSIARALLHDPEIILLDEPTSGLDFKSKEKFYEMLKKIDATIVLTTHSFSEAKELCEKIAVINDGRILGVFRADEITKEDILSLYG